MTIPNVSVVSPDGEHKFGGVTQNEASAYTSRCMCGFEFTGPTEAEQPVRNVRKDAAWTAIADHFIKEVIG